MSGASTNQSVFGEPDESSRLLPDEEGGSPSSQAEAPTPLPKAQLGTLLVVRIIDPIAYTQIFPYINQLLADLRIAAPEQVGFYSGFIVSMVRSPQMRTRCADEDGDAVTGILGDLAGTAVATVAFGWSTSLVTIIVSRFLGGLVAGTIAVLHSMLVEITDDTNQNIAVPIYSLSWSTGSIIGPLIGGTFANAATRYPNYFSWPVFVDHPYLPPCVISAVCTLLVMGLAYLLIEETLPSKRKGSTNGVPSRKPSSASDTDPGSAETGSASVKALLAIPALQALTLSGIALSFLSSAFDVVFTLFCYTPVDAGGLGLQPSTIGNFLAFAGTFAVLLRLVAMPYILRRFDYATIYNTCMYLWPITFAFLPLFNALAPVQSEISPMIGTGTGMMMTTTATASEAGIWIGLALVLALSKVAAIPYSITMLLIKRHAPGARSVGIRPGYYTRETDSRCRVVCSSGIPGTGTGTGRVTAAAAAMGLGSGSGSALGRSNGLVQFAMCLGRAVGPVVVSALFTALNGSTWARRWGVGWAWSVVMVAFGVVGARMTRGIR
ncbi:major facilitator superfamily domain-containing protein [Butyriboletus roseoflavus]|nr:major facilitator superfamily domain-containing protein [Butyriboletus roseoflavus]